MSKSFHSQRISTPRYLYISLPHSLHVITPYSDGLLSVLVSYYPSVGECFSEAGTCCVCGEPYVNSWLDCVQFKKPKQVSKNRTTNNDNSVRGGWGGGGGGEACIP